MKLYKGDCLEIMDMLIKEGVKVDAIITDLPYGTTACKWDTVIPFEQMWPRLKKLSKESTPVVLFGNEPFSSRLRLSNIKEYKYDWKWKKTTPTGFLNAKHQPLRIYEDIIVFYRKHEGYTPVMRQGFKPYRSKQGSVGENYHNVKERNVSCSSGERYPVNIIEFKKDKEKLHPTQKPLQLMEYLVKTYTKVGGVVLDFTMGTGTTGVACKNTGRHFIGIELNEKYFMIAKKRLGKL